MQCIVFACQVAPPDSSPSARQVPSPHPHAFSLWFKFVSKCFSVGASTFVGVSVTSIQTYSKCRVLIVEKKIPRCNMQYAICSMQYAVVVCNTRYYFGIWIKGGPRTSASTSSSTGSIVMFRSSRSRLIFDRTILCLVWLNSKSYVLRLRRKNPSDVSASTGMRKVHIYK